MKLKYPLIIIALCGAMATTTVYAQANPAVPPTTAAAAQWQTPPANEVPSYAQPMQAQPMHEKTRAEVYNELVQAEQDGSLARMNQTYHGG